MQATLQTHSAPTIRPSTYLSCDDTLEAPVGSQQLHNHLQLTSPRPTRHLTPASICVHTTFSQHHRFTPLHACHPPPPLLPHFVGAALFFHFSFHAPPSKPRPTPILPTRPAAYADPSRFRIHKTGSESPPQLRPLPRTILNPSNHHPGCPDCTRPTPTAHAERMHDAAPPSNPNTKNPHITPPSTPRARLLLLLLRNPSPLPLPPSLCSLSLSIPSPGCCSAPPPDSVLEPLEERACNLCHPAASSTRAQLH